MLFGGKVVYWIEELSCKLWLWKEDGLDGSSIGDLWRGLEVGIVLRIGLLRIGRTVLVWNDIWIFLCCLVSTKGKQLHQTQH